MNKDKSLELTKDSLKKQIKEKLVYSMNRKIDDNEQDSLNDYFSAILDDMYELGRAEQREKDLNLIDPDKLLANLKKNDLSYMQQADVIECIEDVINKSKN